MSPRSWILSTTVAQVPVLSPLSNSCSRHINLGSGRSFSDAPSLQAYVPPYCFIRPGGGQPGSVPRPSQRHWVWGGSGALPQCCAVLFLRRTRAQHARPRSWKHCRDLLHPGRSQIGCVTPLNLAPRTMRTDRCLSFRSGCKH